ncbi:MAG: hypothetical protein HYT11_01695 [Candidatus Levybacteria bacterium]|nr:hypothetical protein [Candidatus Levybacteria bacterium]
MNKFQISNFKFQISENGQALITLLIFVVVATIITSAAVIMLVVNITATSKYQQGTSVYYIAESGAENALLRLLRDPSYTGETMAVGNGTATITVSGDSEKTITSEGRIGNFERTLEVQTNFSNNIFTITSWKEME